MNSDSQPEDVHIQLNRLYEEKGRLYASYLRDRPEMLNDQLPDTDVIVDNLLREIRAGRESLQALKAENEQLQRKVAVLSTAGVQLVLKLSRSRIFRWAPLRKWGERLTRLLNRLIRSSRIT